MAMIGTERVPLFVALAFCAGLFTAVGALVGLVFAYVRRDELRGSWGESVLTYFITTFWIGLPVAIVGYLLLPLLIGWPILGLLYVWYALRCLRGTLAAADRRALADPTNWLL